MRDRQVAGKGGSCHKTVIKVMATIGRCGGCETIYTVSRKAPSPFEELEVELLAA